MEVGDLLYVKETRSVFQNKVGMLRAFRVFRGDIVFLLEKIRLHDTSNFVYKILAAQGVGYVDDVEISLAFTANWE